MMFDLKIIYLLIQFYLFKKKYMLNYSLSSRPIHVSLDQQNKKPNRSNRKYHLQLNPQNYNSKRIGASKQSPIITPSLQHYRRNFSNFNSIEQKSQIHHQLIKPSSYLQEQLPIVSRYKLQKPKEMQIKYYLKMDKNSNRKSKNRVHSVSDLQSCKNKKYRIKHKRNDESSYKKQLEKYLENEAEARYPKKQLTDYLIKKKKQELYNYHNMYFQTYYGNQNQFYKLQTLYTKALILKQEPVQITHNRLRDQYQIPHIPLQQDIPGFIQQYQPVNQHIFMKRLINSPAFTVQINSKYFFFGEMVDNIKAGIGIQIRENYCFQGIFRNNKRVEGTQITNDGIYKGQFIDEKRDGNGEFELFSGQYYIGEWKNGNRHGKGIWTNKQGDCYNGEWVKGRSQGYGHLIMNGMIGGQYKGNFVNFKKSGNGIEIFTNGDVYEGSFKQNLPHGQGKYSWKNQTTYQGNFAYGLRNGQGKLTTGDNFIYQGSFADEKPEGYCIIQMPNNDTYEGFLRNGKKNGIGVLRLYSYNKILEGQWEDDVFISSKF